MDFIPLPDGVSSHEPVFDLGGPDYDNQGFLGFDRRQGWNVPALREGDILKARNDWNEYSQIVLKDVSPEDILDTGEGLINAVVGPFIQTWILFGILHEALKRPIDRNEVSKAVTTTDINGRTISTKQIFMQHLFTEFSSKQDDLKADLPWARHLSHCLREAAWVLSDLDRNWETLGGYVVPEAVHLALSVLVQTLDQYSIIFCQPHLEPQNAYVGRCRPAELRLREQRRWCPNMIRRISVDLGLDGLYYASLIPKLGDGQNHDRCEDQVCVASNIDQAKYEVQHTAQYCLCHDEGCTHKSSSCACRSLAMEQDEMVAAFDGEGFPLVRVREGRLEIVRHRPNLPYVALSHVWSDGRGNPRVNALPTCQLQEIQRYVAALTSREDALFWIDTLCVPLQEPLRNTAIMRMAPVYSRASQVLVLSAEVLSINLPSTPDQALFTIFCSRWMARLWTMQEAALAENLVFRFADKPVTYRNLDDAIMNAMFNVSDQSRMIGSRANTQLDHIVNIRRSITDTKSFPVVGWWTGLRYRSTSRPSDVAICGSILLGTDLGRVLSTPNDQKMHTFWSCQQKVPASVLWANGPRLRADGFRWAPSDLLNPVTLAVPAVGKGPAAEPTRGGLAFNGVQAVVLENFPLPTDEEAAFRFTPSGSTKRYLFVKEDRVENETWNELAHVWNRRVAILLPQMPTSASATFAALTMPVDQVEHGSSEKEVKSIQARYLAQIMVFIEGGEYDHSMLQVMDGFDNDRFAIKHRKRQIWDIGDSRCIDLSRHWCIF